MANTSRSRCYFAEMIRQNLLPSYIIYLSGNQVYKLGQANHSYDHNHDFNWPEANFDPNSNLEVSLKNLNIKYSICHDDINSHSVAELISNSGLKTFVYSGFGGIIVKDLVLDLGVNLLHIHGGYLPDFKGSTTNYFSILSERTIGASAIFLTKDLDSGPLITKLKTSEPTHKVFLDHIYDSAVRARVLIAALKILKEKDFRVQSNDTVNEPSSNNYYYIIHPVLKHIAIMS